MLYLGRCITLTLLLLLAVSSVSAQQPVPLHFESFTINDGLSQGYVTSIHQDRKGFMWFGTSDGLNKYDGNDFITYYKDESNNNSIASNDISTVFEDSKERLWIGFNGQGADIYDPVLNTFRHLPVKPGNGLRSGFVLNIVEDRKGFFWVTSREGTERIQLYKDSISSTIIHLDTAFENLRLKGTTEGFLIDSRNRKFICTNDAVYELIFNDSLLTYKLVEKFKFPVADERMAGYLKEDVTNHCFYLKEGTNLWKFPDYDFSKARKLEYLDGDLLVWTIDKNKQLWLFSAENLSQLNTRTGKVRKLLADVPQLNDALKTSTCFYTDRTGVVWIGSGGYGLLKYDPATSGFHHVMRGEGVYQLQEDKEGRIITSKLNAIQLSDDSVRITPRYIDSDSIRKHMTMSFTIDTSGNYWFGGDGLVKYNPVTKHTEIIKIPFPDLVTMPFPVLADKADNIWMGFNRFLMKYHIPTGTFTRYAYPVKNIPIQFDFLLSMYQDEDKLWLGSIIGLFCFDMKQEKITGSYYNVHGDTTSISSNVALSFCVDIEEPERYLWIGTKGGGLNRLDKVSKKFTHFDSRNGLPNNVIYGILPDYNGNLWLSTNKGVSVFNITTRRSHNFDVSDGLQSNEFNRYAFLRTSDGYMIFGGLNGINYFRTEEVTPLEAPSVVITTLRLFNQPVIPGTKGSVLQKSISFTDRVDLSHMDNVISFEFAATDYRKKGSIRYRYKMTGFDKDWIYAGKLHEATYTNLDPGSYTFTVQASFENGQWSADSETIVVNIRYPWYRTWWFFTSLFVILSGAGYVLYRFRQQQLKRLDSMRNKIARDLHDEVGSSISSIAIYSKIVHEHMSDLHDDNSSLLKKISDFATEVMGSMNDIVWNINTKNDAFEFIISHMREHADQLFEANGVFLHFNFDEDLLRIKLSMEIRREFYLIYKESLNNIVKYAGATNVWIKFELHQGNIILFIKDDGKGFDLHHLKRTGNGLTNMQQRAQTLRGKVNIQSHPGKGTEITLTFPS